MTNMRHLVDVVEPAGVLGERGENQGDRTLMRAVQCSIKLLSGREAEIARTRFPTASATISMHGPIKDFGAHCKLLEYPIKDGKAKAVWHVGYVDDPTRTGRELHCLCDGEV